MTFFDLTTQNVDVFLYTKSKTKSLIIEEFKLFDTEVHGMEKNSSEM